MYDMYKYIWMICINAHTYSLIYMSSLGVNEIENKHLKFVINHPMAFTRFILTLGPQMRVYR